MKPALSAAEWVAISVRNTATSRLILATTTLVLILLAACGTAPGAAPTKVTENAQPTQVAPTTEAPPKPASASSDSTPTISQPSSVPVPTLAPIKAQPTPANESRTQAVSSTAIPTTTAAPVVPNPTTTTPDNTPVPTPAPVTAPPPQPTVTLNPTPRPTPGPISRSTQFVPLDEPAYVTRENSSPNITNDSYVLGVANNGEARAYPLDMMWYHHIANDTVGGEPWLVTY
jgi:hypothetical protein